MWLSFQKAQKTSPGFRTANLLTMLVQLPRNDYPDFGSKRKIYNQLEQQLSARFGEDQFGLISRIPLGSPGLSGPILAEHQVNNPSLINPEVGWRMVNPSFFQTMGISLLKGRAFQHQDHEEAGSVVIVDNKVAQRLWPGEDPLGKRLRLDAGTDKTWRTVVGVVEPIKERKMAADTSEQIYLPFQQLPQDKIGIVLRTDGNNAPLVDAVREIVRATDCGGR